VGDLEKMGEIGLAGLPELVTMALRRNLIGAANHPGILGGTVLAELFEEFLEARVELADRAITVEAQRDFVRRGHILVYVRKGAFCEGMMESGSVPKWEELAYTPGVFVRVANTGLTGYGK
jgi:hypothetical protein